MTNFTDLNFAVPFYPDIEISTAYVFPNGTENPVIHTGQSLTSGSNIITGTAGWTTGITAGQRIQAAYKPNDGTGDDDQVGGSPNNSWKRAFARRFVYVKAGSITSTQLQVVDASNVAVNASYTYTNASPPANMATPLNVRTWNEDTVDPTIVNNQLCRYGGWVGYAKSNPNGEDRIFFQTQNFTSFNLKAIGDNTATGTGETNNKIEPGDSLFFDLQDIRDDVAGFGFGYLSKKRKGNLYGATSMSHVDAGEQGYRGAWLLFPPVPGGAQETDIRDPYNTTLVIKSVVAPLDTHSTTPIANNGKTVGISTTDNFAGARCNMTAAPTISNAAAGRSLLIINIDSHVTFRLFDEDQSGNAGEWGTPIATNLRLQQGHRDLAPGGAILLNFSIAEGGTNSYWTEVGYAAGTGTAGSFNFNSPIEFLSGGSTGVDPFTTDGFLGVKSTIELQTENSLGNFIRLAPTVTFQSTATTGTHNAIAIAEKWLSDPATPGGIALLGDTWAMVDSRQFIARSVHIVPTAVNTYCATIWHHRTYWGDLGGTFDIVQNYTDVGERFDLTLKGSATLSERIGTDFNDMAFTPVTYTGATVTASNCVSTSGDPSLHASINTATSPTTGRDQTGFPFLDSDVGKTLTHSGFTGTRTIIGLGASDGNGNYRAVTLDANATSTATATATMADPSITYSPTAPLRQTAHRINQLTLGGTGNDDGNRGIDCAPACFFGGNIYGGGGTTDWLATLATWTITASTGAAQFGRPGGGTANGLTQVANSAPFIRAVRDTGAAVSAAGAQVGGLVLQGTKGTTGASADWTTAASIVGVNDSNATWATNQPGRLEFRTNTNSATALGLILDHQQALHIGPSVATSGNVVSASSVAIDNAGKMWFGPTAYTSGQPSAAPASIDTTGALIAFSGTFGAVGGGTANEITGVTNTNTIARLVRDAGNAATAAGVTLGALSIQGTVGATGSSANWTTAASVSVENDSNAAWSAGVAPGRLLLRTQVSGATGTLVGVAIDATQQVHIGNYGTSSNRINSSYVTVDSTGKTWFGPTAWSAGTPTAAPATMDTTGNLTALSGTFGAVGGGTANEITGVTNTTTIARLIRDAGNAATTAGASIGAFAVQGTVGTTGSSANWTTAASASVENDSNAAWSAGVAPGRLLLRTQVSGATGTLVGIAIDTTQQVHIGNYGTSSNRINSSYVTVDNAGKTWFGPTAWSAGTPTAAAATIDNSGNLSALSLTTSGATTGKITTLDGWIAATNTWTYATGSGGGNATLTLPTSVDASAIFKRGTRIKLTQTTVKYFVCYADADYNVTNANKTTVFIYAGTDYTLANAAITSPFFSFDNPPDYPGWFNYTPTFAGYSADPSTLVYRFKVDGTTVTVTMRDGANGTSNATTASVTLPITAATITNQSWQSWTAYTDNTVAATTPGLATIGSAGTTCIFGKSWDATGAFTNTGGKRIRACTILYTI